MLLDKISSRELLADKSLSRDLLSERRASREAIAEKRASRELLSERKLSSDAVSERRQSRERLSEKRPSRDFGSDRKSITSDKRSSISDKKHSNAHSTSKASISDKKYIATHSTAKNSKTDIQEPLIDLEKWAYYESTYGPGELEEMLARDEIQSHMHHEVSNSRLTDSGNSRITDSGNSRITDSGSNGYVESGIDQSWSDELSSKDLDLRDPVNTKSDSQIARNMSSKSYKSVELLKQEGSASELSRAKSSLDMSKKRLYIPHHSGSQKSQTSSNSQKEMDVADSLQRSRNLQTAPVKDTQTTSFPLKNVNFKLLEPNDTKHIQLCTQLFSSITGVPVENCYLTVGPQDDTTHQILSVWNDIDSNPKLDSLIGFVQVFYYKLSFSPLRRHKASTLTN